MGRVISVNGWWEWRIRRPFAGTVRARVPRQQPIGPVPKGSIAWLGDAVGLSKHLRVEAGSVKMRQEVPMVSFGGDSRMVVLFEKKREVSHGDVEIGDGCYQVTSPANHDGGVRPLSAFSLQQTRTLPM